MAFRTTLLVSTAFLCANAYPHSPIERRADSNNGSGGNTAVTKYIIAGVIIAIFFLAIAILVVRMRKAQLGSGPAANGQTTANAILSANPSSTNLPSTTTTTPATGAARPARRARGRARRTPSQISTKSLPAYMEQPGDEELVLVQRATEPEEYSRDSVDIAYGPSRPSLDEMDEVQTPLMEQQHDTDRPEGDDGDQSRISSRRSHRVNPSFDSVATGSADTHGSDHSTSNLLASQSGPIEPIDERGEAPPYLEHIETSPTHNDSPNATTTTNAENRRSMASRIMPAQLRNFFSGHSHSPSVPMVSLTEPPAGPSTSALASRARAGTNTTVPDSDSPGLFLSRSRSPSNSASRMVALGSALTRPLTNNSSNSSLPVASATSQHQRNRSGSSIAPPSSFLAEPNRLTSPSSTSISSAIISSPLAHTVTRTDYRFPKSGPTPDQLKFLSSRETLGRFGVPFGEDAERTYPVQLPPPFRESSDGASGSGHRSTSSNPENPPPDAEQAPKRARPASWWRNLTQPLGGSSTSTEQPAALSPSTSDPEASTTTSTDDAVPAEVEVPGTAQASQSTYSNEVEGAASIPLPLSARPSLRSINSISLSPSSPSPMSLYLTPLSVSATSASRRSRANSSSSQRTDTTFLTAADTVRGGGSSNPGSDAGFDSDGDNDGNNDDDNEGGVVSEGNGGRIGERPSTPTTASLSRKQKSLSASIHDASFEAVDLGIPLPSSSAASGASGANGTAAAPVPAVAVAVPIGSQS